MSYSVTQVRAWKPIELTDSARKLGESNAAFEAELEQLLRVADAASYTWTGTGADAAYRRIESEHGAGRKIAATVDRLVTALEEGAERLHSVRDNAVTKIDAAVADGLLVNDESWAVSTAAQQSQLMPEQAEALAFHQQAVAAARRQLVDEDRSVSFAIDAAVDEVSATGRDAAAGLRYSPPSMANLASGNATAMLGTPEFAAWMRDHPDAAKELLDSVVDAGLLPIASEFYRDFLDGYWRREAFERSGIDPNLWDPSKGARHNEANIIKAYEYYGQLFLDNPNLKWAGMANMIGPSFAGGFFDLDSLKTIASAVGDGPGLGGLRAIADITEEDLEFYESTFLGMQKEIFEDQASMHEAYLIGGIGEVERMRYSGLLDEDTYRGWREIDAGVGNEDKSLINSGNEELLRREQMYIIADDYDLMRGRPGTGEAMTYLMTAIGAPSIPGAQTYAEFDPIMIEAGVLPRQIPFLPHQIELTTPLPAGNISDRDQRWDLVSGDTLPAYLELVDRDPRRAQEIIATDFSTRMGDQRMLNQVDDIIARLIGGLNVEFR